MKTKKRLLKKEEICPFIKRVFCFGDRRTFTDCAGNAERLQLPGAVPWNTFPIMACRTGNA